MGYQHTVSRGQVTKNESVHLLEMYVIFSLPARRAIQELGSICCLKIYFCCFNSPIKIFRLPISGDTFYQLLCFLTMHLSIILDNDQLDTQLLYFTVRYYNPLHVSSIIYSSSGG